MKDVIMTFDTIDANGNVTGSVKIDIGVDHPAKPTTIKFVIAASGSNPVTFAMSWPDSNLLVSNLNAILAANPNT